MKPVVTVANADAQRDFRAERKDSPGRVHDRFGPGRHSIGEAVGVEEESRLRFIRAVAQRIDEGRRDGEFANLELVAGPRWLGLLRAALPAASARCVTSTLSKDLEHEDLPQLNAHLGPPSA